MVMPPLEVHWARVMAGAEEITRRRRRSMTRRLGIGDMGSRLETGIRPCKVIAPLSRRFEGVPFRFVRAAARSEPQRLLDGIGSAVLEM